MTQADENLRKIHHIVVLMMTRSTATRISVPPSGEGSRSRTS